MDSADELCSSFAHREVSRSDFIRRALKLGLSVAAVGALVDIYRPSAEGREAATTLGAMSGDFDYKKYAGKTVKLRLSKHPYVEALLPELPIFEKQTGIKVEYDITPEEQYFDSSNSGSRKSRPTSTLPCSART